MAESTLLLKLKASGVQQQIARIHNKMVAFDRSVGKLQGSLDRLARTSKSAWDRFGNHVRNARRRVQVATAKMKKAILGVKGVLAGLAIGAFVKNIFSAAATMERFEMQFTTLTGSATKAKEVMADLQELNKKSPFELPDLVKASAKLKAYGVETEDLVDMTGRLGKISAATRSDIGGISLAYGQALAKGKLMGEELRQFMERGVPVREELERMTGLTGDKFDEAMRKGKISSAMLTEAIKNMTGETGQFGKAFENTANSMDTKLSNMRDAFFQASAALGKAFAPVFKWVLDSLTVIFNTFTKLMAQIQRGLDVLGRRLEANRLAAELAKEKGFSGFKGKREMKKQGITRADLREEALANLEKSQESQAALDAKLPQLVNGVNELNNVSGQVAVKWESIRETIASGLTSAIEGLISGTQSLGESLAGIAKSIASMYLKSAITSFLPGLPASAEGRYASSPMVSTLAEKGEPEYVIPSGRMAEATARYQSGQRGESVIPRGGGSSNYSGGSGGATVVSYNGPVLNFNSEEFVPKSAIGEIINSAASRGARAGEARTISSLKNSRSRRSTLGL
tara:strand:+ start:2506 stop:4218 length:1713 start_codon:yes stop_codon:yes gene_type:complete